MNKQRRYLVIVGLLALLAIILWQAPRSPLRDLVSDDEISPTKQYPVAYLNNIKTTQYNQQGQIAHTLTASKISHFEQTLQGKPSSYAILEKPNIIIFNTDKASEPPWHASSTHGRSINHGEELILEGNVILKQQSFSGDNPAATVKKKPLTVITTEQLRIKPNQQYAETDKPVMIKNDFNTSTATGLTISLNTQRIEMLSKVRGHYERR